MDDEISRLREELSKMLRKAAELKVRLDRFEGKVRGVPHDSVIEEAAHELGREDSRLAQALHLNELVADDPQFARCPKREPAARFCGGLRCPSFCFLAVARRRKSSISRAREWPGFPWGRCWAGPARRRCWAGPAAGRCCRATG